MKIIINIIKKIIGLFLILLSILILLIMIVGILDNQTDLETKFNVNFILLIFLMVFFGLGKSLLKQKNKHSNSKTNDYMNTNSYNKKRLEEINTYIIEFPFFGYKVIEGETEENYKYYSGKEAYKLLSKEKIEEINNSWNNSNMVQYISNKSIKSKISDISLFINATGTCRIFVKVLSDLSEEEKNLIINFVSGQMSDGWGETNFYFNNEKNEVCELSFWKNSDDWYIKYIEDELFDEFVNSFKNKTKKECYKIDLIDETPQILDNKIGGTPYIPVDESYPLDKNGNPMILLLQVNLKDIKLEGYPTDGILEIFIAQEYDSPSEDYKIKYYKDGLKYQTNFPTILKDDAIPYVDGEYKIKLNKTIDYMSIGDFRFNEVINEIISDVYGINSNEYNIGFDFS